MNDRFAAQLRMHLLESADERPADGQLASVIDGVAATSQRHPLTARLGLGLERIGPVPTAAIRFGLIAAALAIAAAAGAIMAGGPTKPSSVFEGTWITIDPVDGSGMTLVVGPGQTPAVYFEDGYATGGACANDAVKRFTARGTGEILGNSLVATFPDGGGCGLMTVGVAGIYDHVERADTLTDQDGVVWTRALGDRPEAQAPETPAPAMSSEPEAQAPSPYRSPPPVNATFVSTLHGISINHPEGWQTRPATELWTGGALDFDSPAADVIYDPALGDRLYLLVASQPYGDLVDHEWRDSVLAWTCPGGGGEMWSWQVDGAYTWQEGPCNSGSIVHTDARGYLIRLVASSDEPGLAESYDWDWLRPLLDTVDLRPEDAVEPPSSAPSATPAVDPSVAPSSATPAVDPSGASPSAMPAGDPAVASPSGTPPVDAAREPSASPGSEASASPGSEASAPS